MCNPKMCSKRLALVVLVFLCYLNCAAPVRLKREYVNESVHNYLMKYGYLSKNADGSGALRTEESVRRAIRELQEFGGLPVTGQLDERTVKLLTTKRCGMPDVLPSSRRRKRFMLQGQKWQYTNLTWSLETNNLGHLNSYDVRLVIQKALEVWERHSRLTFTEWTGHNKNKADIVVSFHSYDHGDNFAFDGKGQVLAHAFFPGSGRGGDAHFDVDEIWLTREDENQEEGTSLFHVAAHEFGHSLGLQHSSVEGALMFPWYQGMQNGFNYELPEDDRLAIQTLYGSHQERQWERRPVYEPPPTQPPPPPPPPRTRPTRPPERPRYHPTKPHYPRKPMNPDRKHHNKYYTTTKHPHRSHPFGPDKYPWKPERIPTTTPTTTTTEVYKERTPTHRRHHWPGKEGSNKKPAPDTCDTSYDAVAVIRREVFIFKDAYFWRIGDNGLLPGYPVEIMRMWNGLPQNFTHVDAVYERPDNKIVFFVGRMYYVYTGNVLDRDFPRPLTALGFPENLNKIDGATIWGHNGKTFFFSGNLYWRFDEEMQRVELDYPRLMDMWTGVGPDIDAVFQWKDGKTYFFKGKGFWKFNDLRMKVENEKQTPSGPFWMGCTRNLEGHEPGYKSPYTGDNDIPSSTARLSPTLIVVIFTALLKLCLYIT